MSQLKMPQFFSHHGFLSLTLTICRTAGKRREPSFFLSTLCTRSLTFRHLFPTMHLRLLLCIFNCMTRNYQATI